MNYLFLFGMVQEEVNGYNDDLTMAFCIGMWVRDTGTQIKTRGYGND